MNADTAARLVALVAAAPIHPDSPLGLTLTADRDAAERWHADHIAGGHAPGTRPEGCDDCAEG